MKRIQWLLAVSSLLLLTQCQRAYWVQLNKISSTNCKENPTSFIFENDSLSIEYIFEGENGNMMFAITNKLQVPLYVDWKKCNYIINNNRNKYYSENETIVTNGLTVTYEWQWFFSRRHSTSISKNQSFSIVKKEERITFLPPGTMVVNNMSGINTAIIPLNQDKKGKKLTSASQKFEVNSSPLVLRNYLTFSLKEDFNDEFMMDHTFYLSGIENAHENKVSELAIDSETGKSYMKEIDMDGKTFFVRYK